MNALEAKLAQMSLTTPAAPVPTGAPPVPGDIHTYSAEAYPAKQDTRRATLDILRDPAHPTSLWYDGHLTCDWAELCGDAPDASCKFLLAEGALTPNAKFIGMNSSQRILDRNAQSFAAAADRTRWICGQAEHLVLDRSNPDLRNVGVFVFDGFNSPSNANLENILIPILAFAKSQYRRRGQFLLVINLALRGNAGLSLAAGIRQYEAILQAHFKTGPIPEGTFKDYTSKKVPMRLLRLTYGW